MIFKFMMYIINLQHFSIFFESHCIETKSAKCMSHLLRNGICDQLTKSKLYQLIKTDTGR